jgi:glucosamine-6-phosphate deaminase
MNFHFFDKINIDKKNTFLPNGCASDLDAECVEYEKKIKEFGGIDLQLLGIGISGHIGFNEPLSALFSRTRVKALCPATLKQNSKYFDNVNKIPKRAFTMGIGTILDAKRILMMATGKKKAEILLKALEGPVTAMVSATALQLHPKTVVVLDEESASMLEGKDYYKWIFDNEPEWEIYR